MIIKNANIHDAINEKVYIADILIRNGKFEQIAKNIENTDEEVIDATGLEVYPGMVEAHCHIGLNNYAKSTADVDINEKNDNLTPHLRAKDGFDPFDYSLKKALNAGVTTVCTGPGSANVVGGTFIVAKTYGTCVDDMIISDNMAMKCAFGENPKNIYGTKSINTRMTIAAYLRDLLFKTKEYLQKKNEAADDESKMPKFDMKLEAMIPVIKGEIPLKAHAHRAYDICTAIRIAKEFGVKLTIEHCTEGHLIVEELKRAGYPVAVGPTMTNAKKLEIENKSFETAGVLANAGLKVSITTDSPVICQEYLPITAGMAVKAGMKPFDALKAITINPAEHIGVSDRVGSIEVGKDADLVITDGDIFSNMTNVLKVIVDGKLLVNNSL